MRDGFFFVLVRLLFQLKWLLSVSSCVTSLGKKDNFLSFRLIPYYCRCHTDFLCSVLPCLLRFDRLRLPSAARHIRIRLCCCWELKSQFTYNKIRNWSGASREHTQSLILSWSALIYIHTYTMQSKSIFFSYGGWLSLRSDQKKMHSRYVDWYGFVSLALYRQHRTVTQRPKTIATEKAGKSDREWNVDESRRQILFLLWHTTAETICGNNTHTQEYNSFKFAGD